MVFNNEPYLGNEHGDPHFVSFLYSCHLRHDKFQKNLYVGTFWTRTS